MNVNNMSESQINTELLARHSRTSGTLESRRQRLQRFLEFEDQKGRRNEYVQTQRQEQGEAVDECYDGCPCTYGREQTEEERVARVLMDLRDDAERSEYYINHLIPRVKALEDIVASMEKRITQLELADMPGLTTLQESNPNWTYTETPTSPYAWECTQFN
jgi:uncharacterized protein YceH (UPF0502 family)